MGRPIKKIFIGERGPGEGGSGIADVELIDGGTGYTAGALVISAPDLADGVQATGTFTETGGVIDGVTITDPGSGYTSEPTIDGDAGGNGDAILRAVFDTESAAVIAATAFLPGGSNLNADIIAQKGGTTYRVATADGVGECTLVQATPTAEGEMAIPATDSGGATYWVQKLFNRTVVLTENSGGGEFATNDRVGWADIAVLNTSVKITA